MADESKREDEGEAREVEEKGKRGRKTNAERLIRERSGSLGNMKELNELWKRKREELEEKGIEDAEEARAFQKSKLMERSPSKGEQGGGSIERILRGMSEELKSEMREVRDEIRGQGREVKEELARSREERRIEAEEWRGEKRDLEERIRKMEEKARAEAEKDTKIEELIERVRVLELEREAAREKGEGGGETQGRGRKERAQVEERVDELEWWMEMKERESRRRNIIIRGREIVGTARQTVERVIEESGARATIEEVREIGRGREGKSRATIEVRLGSMEEKREVMTRRRNIRDRKVKVEDDMTWKQRRMQWRLGEIGREEESRGKRVKVSYGKIWINGTMWFWDERKGVLRDGRGRERDEGQLGAEETVESEEGRLEEAAGGQEVAKNG